MTQDDVMPVTLTPQERWERDNAAFLGAGLEWLRELLRRHTQSTSGATEPAAHAVAEPAAQTLPGPGHAPIAAVPPSPNPAQVPPGDAAPAALAVDVAASRSSWWERRRSRLASQVPGTPGDQPAQQPEEAPHEQPEHPPNEHEPVSADQQTDRPADQLKDAGTSPDRADGETSPDDTGGDPLAAAAARMRAAAGVSPPPALVGLAARLGLSPFERDVLLMAVAPELDPSIGELFAAAHHAEQMSYPTFALALAAFPDAAWDATSPQGALRHWRLVEVGQAAGSPLVSSPLHADERIVDHVKGLDYVDARLAPLVTALTVDGSAVLPASQQAALDRCVAAWERSPARTPVIHLAGAQPGSKQLVAALVSAAFGLTAYRLPASELPAHVTDIDQQARLWEREAALTPVALYLDADDDVEGSHEPPLLSQFLSRMKAPVMLSSRDGGAPLGRAGVVVDVAPPTTSERAAAWHTVLDPAPPVEVDVDVLAAQFALDLPAIHEVAATTEPDDVWDACLARTRPRLDGLAQRLRPAVHWNDLVLPDHALTVLRQIADQVPRQATVYETWGFGERLTRGLGVTALFAGPSGTGKTMAAEVLAHELRLDLYRTDLSAVMSKYIGETEKNLRRLFDAAEAGGAVLLIDEADALLGKRSEVKDSHDRYANVQIDYLLQRMENYRGLAIMATNMRSALDVAFLRRLRFVVEFPFPDQAQRRDIWLRSFPAGAPGRGNLDYDRLAALDVSGGMARNIAVNAAFLAAASGLPISMPMVLRAAREEFRKLQQPVRERDFAWTAPLPGPAPAQPSADPAGDHAEVTR